ncbi:acyl-CoA dehydrogenase family protein [Gordonia polyisoprenivorans]|uniref:acyl-CoA dehydrogenase family protein n=1 Tax=Gordonia polyisoprenivorans TaxID=84595 RepID=UPI002301C718|nr:acyl-CoA dehydrogenase family protein [Gordonia polyisoprenivorans]WCB38975.1 acyl-CoA/acyl-ACP dehydrogenase [Gordonia polyisoprenivorans]
MDFSLTDDQQVFRAEIRRFAEQRLRPHYQADDATGRMTPSIFDDMAAVGLFGLRVPERLGGAGADAVTVGIAAEEVARSNINAGYALLSTALVCDIFLAAATEAQLSQWLPPIAEGRVVPTLALTEPGHGSDAANIELAAKPSADGWEISGEKTSISLTEDADHAVVFARTGAPGARGVSAFYVPLIDPAVTRVRLDDIANRAAGRCSLFFDQLPVTRDQLVGTEGSGFVSVMQGFEYSRAIIGLLALGTAAAALDDAIDYAKQRSTFGAPISTRQGVAFPLVEHLTYVAGARHLCYEALWRKDQGLDHTAHASMVKWWAPKAAVEAIHQALLTFGHAAWSAENPQAQRLRDAMGFEIADGTAQIAKLVVARSVFGRQYAP